MCSSAHKAHFLRMLIREIRAAVAGARKGKSAEPEIRADAPADPPPHPAGSEPATA